MRTRHVVICIAMLIVLAPFTLLASTSSAEDFPDKNIRWILGGQAGGGFDLYARAIGRYMEKYLPSGIHVIVENQPGAGHKIAMSAVYSAKPDGYVIGMPHMPGLYIDQMYKKQNYDMKKTNWLGMIYRDPRVLAVSPKSNFKSIDDIKKAESVTFGIVGFASEADLLLANGKMKIKSKYISGHKNSNEAVLAVLRGDADAVAFTYGSLRDFIKNKQLIPLAVLGSEKRIEEIPDVPTLGELGNEDINQVVGAFRVISAPPDMPEDRLTYLRDLIWKAMSDKEFIEWSVKSKRPIDPQNGEEAAKVMENLMNQYDQLKEELRPFIESEQPADPHG